MTAAPEPPLAWEPDAARFDQARRRVHAREMADRAAGIPRRSAGFLAFEAYAAASNGPPFPEAWARLSDAARAFWNWVGDSARKDAGR